LPQSQTWRYTKHIQSRELRITVETEGLTQGFFLLVHEDRRIDAEANGYTEIEYDGDLAEPLRFVPIARDVRGSSDAHPGGSGESQVDEASTQDRG